jgi:periplasmic divalent cation tolerance protein
VSGADDVVQVITTVAREEDAVRIARLMIEEKLFACASWKTVRSVYSWKGELVDETEQEITLKTSVAQADRAERRLREIHPYETPAILRLPILRADPDYAAWVRSSVSPSAESDRNKE